VLDIRLPDRRGEEILRTLKADAATRGIPIIVVTVEDDDGRIRQLGADDHLTKPIAADRLATWLARIGHGEPVGAGAGR
jgi:CheY-like chemotaxis protein